MAVVHVYLIPGTMSQVPAGWCTTCQLPSVWTGPVWRLSPAGADLHGQVTGCADCDDWTTEPADAVEADLRRVARPAARG